jgi:hypothetical protein
MDSGLTGDHLVYQLALNRRCLLQFNLTFRINQDLKQEVLDLALDKDAKFSEFHMVRNERTSDFFYSTRWF